MTSKSAPEVLNDNNKSRLWYKGADDHGSCERLTQHIPAARQLIKRFCKHHFKHDVNDIDYAYLEYQLCGLLDQNIRMPNAREHTLSLIALLLEEPKLRLHNAPDLPF